MLYCEQCKMLVQERCQKGSHALREPRENDPVLLVKADTVQAAMLEEMLKQGGIPTLKEGRMGAGLATWAGPMLEEYSLFVPYQAMEQALAIISPPPADEAAPAEADAEEEEDGEDWEEHFFMNDEL